MAKSHRQPSVMSAQKRMSQVPSVNIKRSRFDRSHAHKTTIDSGKLYPIYIDEVLPGDTFTMRDRSFARLATPLKPVMDNMYIDTHYFFVPYRLVWENWEKFMGERENPDDNPNDYTIPQRQFSGMPTSAAPAYDRDWLHQYFGLPIVADAAGNRFMSVSALPFRAYRLIWNQWYRDQNFQDSVPVPKGDGPDGPSAEYPVLLRRGKRRDYFTSALPWPQKGDPVQIPLGDTAPVTGEVVTFLDEIEVQGNPPPGEPINSAGGSGMRDPFLIWQSNPANTFGVQLKNPEARSQSSSLDLVADLSEATAITINDLRNAFAIQRLLERDARGGTRYIELILSHFGVKSDDARLQRAEFLGGGTTRVNIHPIPSTVHTPEEPQGNLAGFATSVGNAGFQKSFTEHGLIIGLVSARADLTYQRGIERFWSHNTRYDIFWPSLAHLGEQAILNKEVNFRGIINVEDPEGDFGVFGYQERYAEYRYKPSKITGLFNSDAPNSLDVWHLAQDFDPDAYLPLNEEFIEEHPPIGRVIAVPDEPELLLDVWFDLKCDRPMPVYGIPGGAGGHF